MSQTPYVMLKFKVLFMISITKFARYAKIDVGNRNLVCQCGLVVWFLGIWVNLGMGC